MSELNAKVVKSCTIDTICKSCLPGLPFFSGGWIGAYPGEDLSREFIDLGNGGLVKRQHLNDDSDEELNGR